jgi:hypothetical protein
MKIPENIEHDVKWIEEKHKIKVSKFMLTVLSILSKTFGGLHHTDATNNWKKKDFIQTRYIEYSDFRDHFSTFDYNELTKLVLLAHEKGIRISIGVNRDSSRNKRLILSFANRMGVRKGCISKRHPSLQELVKTYFPKDKSELKEVRNR